MSERLLKVGEASRYLGCYIFFRKRYFEISYTGGNIAFKASNYTVSETQDFQKALHSAKDRSDAMS